jgi:hypothetical protein
VTKFHGSPPDLTNSRSDPQHYSQRQISCRTPQERGSQ